ncbi:MAG: energy transducer TonB [Chitinophagaceae bacterium]|nr:energy transducer TonB [Chitinophagaceae bacterium]MCZ2397947.1 energy transducer TonB [Chitinophagales bacterium]
MMDPKDILKSDFLDILFDGRNKAYGAYQLRRTYNRRLTIALSGMALLALLVIGGNLLASKLKPKEVAMEMITNETTLQNLKADEPPPPPPPPPPALPPPPQVQTIQFTPPRIVKDEEVVQPPPEVKQIEEAKIDIKTQEGTKDLGIIAPPAEEVGTQVVAAPVEKKEDEDRIFTKVEKDAQFPGGLNAWNAYVKKAIEREIDEFTDSDFGTCIVKFVVDKQGNVSDVQATTMKGTKLAEIAVNAIRKGPKWIPAQQNGRMVNAYRYQPVTLLNPN